jgi:flagellar export protein FliJ
MKIFRFRLQTFMDLRAKAEQQAKINLGAITGKCQEIDTRIELLGKEKIRLQHEATQSDELFRDLDMRRRYFMRLDKVIEDLLKERAQCEIVRLKAMDVYQQKKKEFDILEKLKEEKYKEFRKESLLQEQHQLDEIGISRYLDARETILVEEGGS